MYKLPRRLMLAATVIGALMAQSRPPGGFTPVLEIEKPVYLVDESIRFWVSVNADAPIPEGVRSSCVLHWVRPDATAFDERIPWPIDGDPTRGWLGGWGFRKESPGIGRYTVSFEFAGHRTAAQSFNVVSDPFKGRIAAHWIFAVTGSVGGAHTHSALLHVENRTGRALRFAKPGLMGSEAWLELKTFQPPSTAAVPVLPAAAEIPGFSLNRLDWDNQSKWPMIEVAAGGSVDRPLALGTAYAFREGQEYEATIHTVLTVFVGERGDSDAGIFPLRMPVFATARFRW